MKQKARTPIEQMIDAAVKCTNCGVQGAGNCACWDASQSPKQLPKLRPGPVHLPASTFGEASIVVDSPDSLARLRASMHGMPMDRKSYTRLFIGSELVMTDAEFDIWSNQAFVSKACGSVLIFGLGIGLVLPALLGNPSVTDVTVVEVNADVIGLVGPKYENHKLTIIRADARTWCPQRGSRWDSVYIDIWPDFNEDRVADARTIKRRLRRYVRSGGFIMDWASEAMRMHRRTR